ncbi:hypothetical protein C5167_035465 [Papaver somniferum]|uniref:Uncharacterized protein n=1 Tax=Papaver somniferum TaxID=3469 RepID=A0A4Y7KHH9_PAPSO|nr:hypothetical protein C5167_035465 [Papaver somniferum]
MGVKSIERIRLKARNDFDNIKEEKMGEMDGDRAGVGGEEIPSLEPLYKDGLRGSSYLGDLRGSFISRLSLHAETPGVS